jgi:hypothetical protein
VSSAIAADVPNVNIGDTSALKKSGDRVLRAMRTGDIDNVIPMLSNGIFISERQAHYTSAGKIPSEELRKDVQLVDNLSIWIWKDREVFLERTDSLELAKLKIGLKRFAQRMKDTYGSLEASLDLKDAWNLRTLGPAVSGKVASNTFWYIYFRKEGAEWKIWKLEYASH